MGEARSSTMAFAAAYVVLVVGLFLALGGAAYAQSPADDQYGTKVAGVSTSGGQPGAEAQQVAAAEALPNTGLSLLAVAVVGGGLVGAGILLRRRERRSDD